MLAAALLWFLIVLEAALFAAITYRRRVPLFRLWLVFAIMSALTYHPWAGHEWWLAWARSDAVMLALRFLVVVEAFWIATMGLPSGFRALLATTGTAIALTAVIAVWSQLRYGLALFVQVRLYCLVWLAVFCVAVIGCYWAAGKRPKPFALRHGLLVTWILACYAIPACLDRFIVTGTAWRLATNASTAAMCLGLAWGVWSNVQFESWKRTRAPAQHNAPE